MPLDNIKEFIANNQDSYIEQLFTLLRQKSISTQNDGITECAELLKDMMEELGISTQIMKTNGHPSCFWEHDERRKLLHVTDLWTL